MARIKQGFLGNASGKLGNVVFSKWRDQHTARQYQPDVHDAKTPAQLKQRNRMYALLQFLKPLNKNFIKFFNSNIAKGSTPWAVAIKNNMKCVSDEGCIELEELELGDPECPELEISKVVYNPFIDQTSFSYNAKSIIPKSVPFPYIGVSVLGKYKTLDGTHEFDTRHVLCFLPPGHFFCSIYTETAEWAFDNWWGGGMFWMMFYDTYDMDRHCNPNNGLTKPVYFKPTSMIEGFNTLVKENPVPKDAITWEYQTIEKKNFLVFNIDYKKTQIKNPKDYFIRFWKVSIGDGTTQQFDAVDWDLSLKSFKAELIDSVARRASIVLYSVYKKSGEQVACFNRFYIDKNIESKEFPYFWQLFTCWYANPSSFVLNGRQCGFCGSVDELFSDFIQLYEQGVIHNGGEPEPPTEYILRMGDDPNGKIEISGFVHEEGDIYYYTEKTNAVFVPKPNPGYVFSAWVGVDSGDVIATKADSYELPMIKDRSLSPVFKVLV
ncbi:MAG: hypothetical protein A2309_03330 [Bacteroidetes bacterium RIFOXYB2_FULL_35_7]|nr:MAG: hypothetical protein A2X01_14705 [Bacteroidetes bacterium GWF2_35_48]OFY97667.1 MAG: hypothetical protein A2309_03330 [Bacteroidetes bacterium RIFOXYB2_FULL_35_7]OFZ01034.1 MAG: hypothetical protein A2491_17610 [Bacteroidetes bacterium RIFOXYC12_FULL_35_7]HBX53564.1 hypothetical protein [Bacteroidales bacterium]